MNGLFRLPCCSIWYFFNSILVYNFYKSISILVTLAKVDDAILNRTFVLWYPPNQEKAGGQEGRGCTEQLLTLCILIDIARKTKQTLYIAFIDYMTRVHKCDTLPSGVSFSLDVGNNNFSILITAHSHPSRHDVNEVLYITCYHRQIVIITWFGHNKRYAYHKACLSSTYHIYSRKEDMKSETSRN